MPTTDITRALAKAFAGWLVSDAANAWLRLDVDPDHTALVVREVTDFLVEEEYLPRKDIEDTHEMFENWAGWLGLELSVDLRWSKGPNYRQFFVPLSVLLQYRDDSDEIDKLLLKVEAIMTRRW
tara:strand:+ start:142 stop:513 length:372 start_codon:yes stop_codon:yes gene_type:complete